MSTVSLCLLSSFSYKGAMYAVGDGVYLPLDKHRFAVKSRTTPKTKTNPSVSSLIINPIAPRRDAPR